LIAKRVVTVVRNAADRRPVGGLPPKPSLLNNVFGLGDAAEDPVGDAEQPRPLAGELDGDLIEVVELADLRIVCRDGTNSSCR
jgi:hypothetical protein